MTIDGIINILATVTVFEMMITIGLRVTIADVIEVAKNWGLVLRAILANYVIVPAAAVGLLLLFRAQPLVAAGFLIAAVCPGAPYGPPFTAIAKGTVVLSVGLMIILAGSSALIAPLLLRVLLPLVSGDQPMHVNATKIVASLLGAQFLPLCLGLFVRHRFPVLATRLEKLAQVLSLFLNVATIGAIFAIQFQMLIGIPLKGFIGMSALIIAAFAAGWLLGGPRSGDRTTMAMAASVRNVAVSLVIATASFPGTSAITATAAFALFQTIVMALVALVQGRMAAAAVPAAG